MRSIYCNELALLLIFASFNKIVVTTEIPANPRSSYIRKYVEDDVDYHQDFNERSESNYEMGFNSAINNKNNDVSTRFNNTVKKYDTRVIAQQGTTAVLRCNIRNEITNTTVIAWKKKDIFLTNNSDTLDRDKRFYATNDPDDPTVWTLRIRYSQPSDKGVYECEIYNNHSTIAVMELDLIEAHAEIIGESPKMIYPGLPLRLICELKNSLQPPEYIFWYHWDRVINYDLWDGATVRQGRQGSELIFPRAEPEHAGNYSCVPSNARQASVEIKYNGTSKSMELGNINGGVTCRIRDHISNMLLLVMVLQNVNVTTI